MSWQLCCHDICKIVARLDHYCWRKSNTSRPNEIWILSSYIFSEMDPLGLQSHALIDPDITLVAWQQSEQLFTVQDITFIQIWLYDGNYVVYILEANGSLWGSNSGSTFGPLVQTILKLHFDGLVQDCSISIANALEILQSCAKPLMWYNGYIQTTEFIVHPYRKILTVQCWS